MRNDDIGGLITFYKDKEGKTNIRRVKSSTLQMVLANTGLPKNTGNMITKVAMFRNRMPEVVDAIFDVIGTIVQEVTTMEGDELVLKKKSLCEGIRLNQQFLSILGVSCNEIDEIVTIAQKHGYEAKLSGGGGGGCVICFPTNEGQVHKTQAFLDHLKEADYEAEVVELGGEGLIIYDE